jgi:hypothetical protein
MSQVFASKYARELEEVITKVAWQQWRAIGGSAASKERWHSIVDPEALILASLFLADREPRIENILLSWVEANAPLLSVQRLKNLQSAYPPEVRSRVAAFARRAKSLARHPRWDALSKEAHDDSFPALPDVRRATRVPTADAASLMLRMRMAFGVGVKADVLSMVLGNPRQLTIRDVADNLGYTVVGIRTAVHDLSRAGFIMPVSARPLAFTAPIDRWRALLGLSAEPHWATWHHWFAFAIDYVAWSDKLRAKPIGDYAMDAKARELIARHELFYRYASQSLDVTAVRDGAGFAGTAVDALADWPRKQEARAVARE